MNNFKQFQESVATRLGWQKMVVFKLPNPVFTGLKKACAQAREKKIKANPYLVGHIKEEYNFDKVSDEFIKYIGTCTRHKNIIKILSDINCLSKNCPVYLHELWVNYMKKHEFNPPHNHLGALSFVIFVKIPYNLKEEEKYFTPQKPHNFTSKFVFHNINPDGSLRIERLDVDKSFEGVMLMFPSAQVHEVFPFYTSEGYRITVSGNIRFKV